MKVCLISDTHGLHHLFELQEGDLLIHSGDVSSMGKPEEILEFFEWFIKQPYKHKVWIAGNHDFFMERILKGDVRGEQETKIKERLFSIPGVHYLYNSDVIIEGYRIWGSPYTPSFGSWAFGLGRGKPLADLWSQVPANTDILVTHGPPKAILDLNYNEQECGCEELTKLVKQLKPKLHVFGHIHESMGSVKIDKTVFVNASMVDGWNRVYKQDIFELPYYLELADKGLDYEFRTN
jgi:predicted phosphodiesterase